MINLETNCIKDSKIFAFLSATLVTGENDTYYNARQFGFLGYMKKMQIKWAEINRGMKITRNDSLFAK